MQGAISYRKQGALFSVDDDVLTSSLCQVERRKSKTLEYSNKVLQGPAAKSVVGRRKGPYQLAIPLEVIPSNDGHPQRLREATFASLASLLWRRNAFHHLACIALRTQIDPSD